MSTSAIIPCSSYNPADQAKPDEDWKPGDGKVLPLEKFAPYTTAKQPPYESLRGYALTAIACAKASCT